MGNNCSAGNCSSGSKNALGSHPFNRNKHPARGSSVYIEGIQNSEKVVDTEDVEVTVDEDEDDIPKLKNDETFENFINRNNNTPSIKNDSRMFKKPLPQKKIKKLEKNEFEKQLQQAKLY